jgi:cytochrome c biogenesis protein CcdA
MGFVVALLLGLRHASDPDHLTAVSTLLLADARNGPRRATMLGLAWGLGHATTLVVFGLPVVIFRRYLPDSIQRAAEAVIGLVIVALAIRLLIRWQRGYFHVHPHRHGSVQHVHPHAHEQTHEAAGPFIPHAHPHAEGLGRSPLTAFGIGMAHGVGGSAGVGVLLVSAVSSQMQGVLALVIFAAATAISMALVSTAFGHALARGAVKRRLAQLVPLLGAGSLLFGVWYSLGALRSPL